MSKINNFYFHTSLWYLRKVSFFSDTEKKCENKKFMSFSPPIPLRRQGLRFHFAELPTYAIFVSLTIKVHRNSIETFRVTNKQCYKIISF